MPALGSDPLIAGLVIAWNLLLLGGSLGLRGDRALAEPGCARASGRRRETSVRRTRRARGSGERAFLGLTHYRNGNSTVNTVPSGKLSSTRIVPR